jgi:hypothetical protein
MKTLYNLLCVLCAALCLTGLVMVVVYVSTVDEIKCLDIFLYSVWICGSLSILDYAINHLKNESIKDKIDEDNQR